MELERPRAGAERTIDAQIPALEVLSELGDDPGKHQVLCQGIESGHIHYVHAAILKPAPR